MESDWRFNVVRQGWDSWWASPSYIYPSRVVRLAYLITPVVRFGVTYTGVMSINHPDGMHYYLVKTGLSPMESPYDSLWLIGNPGPFPCGFAVLPDH